MVKPVPVRLLTQHASLYTIRHLSASIVMIEEGTFGRSGDFPND